MRMVYGRLPRTLSRYIAYLSITALTLTLTLTLTLYPECTMLLFHGVHAQVPYVDFNTNAKDFVYTLH